jgi:hypothetical protein
MMEIFANSSASSIIFDYSEYGIFNCDIKFAGVWKGWPNDGPYIDIGYQVDIVGMGTNLRNITWLGRWLAAW